MTSDRGGSVHQVFTPPLSRRPESLWLTNLPPASRILFMGERNSTVYAQIRGASSALGVPLELFSPSEVDHRLRKMARESYAAIYWEQRDFELPLEQAQRIFAMVFQALLPQTGNLIFTRNTSQWDDVALESLLRQTGFRPPTRYSGGDEKLWICTRV